MGHISKTDADHKYQQSLWSGLELELVTKVAFI